MNNQTSSKAKKASKPKKKKKVKINEDVQQEDGLDRLSVNTNIVVVPPDGGWGWFVVFVSFVGNSVFDSVVYMFGIFLQDITKSFDCDESFITLSNSIFSGMYFFMSPFACSMVNRIGFRFSGMIGASLSVIGLIASAFSIHHYMFLLSYGFLCGTSFSIYYIASLLAVSFYFEKNRAIATAIAVTGSSVGILLFPPLFNIVLSDLTWRSKYMILAFAAAVIGIMCLVYKPIKPVWIERKTEKEEDSDSSLSISEDNPKSMFYKKHNMSYSTASEFVVKDSTGGGSRSSFKSDWTNYFSASSYTKHVPCSKCCRKECMCCRCLCLDDQLLQPMYKDDIFYTGSVVSLPQYVAAKEKQQQQQQQQQSSQQNMRNSQSMEYQLSVTRLSSVKDMVQAQNCCVCCPESCTRTLATMLDLSLMKSGAFVTLAMSGFFTYWGLYIPYIYIIEYAVEKKVTKSSATLLISTLGISNGIGRICMGLLSLSPKISSTSLTIALLLIAGASLLVVPFMTKSFMFFIICVIHGFSTACLPTLRPVIAVEMVGLENLSNAIGLIILFEGFSAFSGAPIAAKLKSMAGNADPAFYFAGTTILLSAFVLMPMKALKVYEVRKLERKEAELRFKRQQETRKRLEELNKPKPKRK